MKKSKYMLYRYIQLSLIITVIIGLNTGCHKKTDDIDITDYKKTLVLTVDDSKIYLDELMYHVMITKLQGQLYGAFLNEENFWDKEYKDGVTMEDIMKKETMDNAIKYELLYQSAIKDDYTLSDEEIKVCSNQVDSILESVPKVDINDMQLTEERLLQIQEKIAISTSYYQNKYKEKGIDDEAAYEDMKENHDIKINEKVWKTVSLAEIKK
jgi:hypothetical protein